MKPSNPLSPSAERAQQEARTVSRDSRDRYRATIIIVNYNGRGHLDRAIRSLGEDSRWPYEVILVDNGSSDGSAEYVAARYPEVRLIQSWANLGFGAANNRAASQAKGEYLAFLNPDTEAEPGWLEGLIGALEEKPDAGLVTAQVLLMHDPERINACGNDIHLTGFTLCHGLGTERQFGGAHIEVASVSGAAFAMRRDLFEALGGFDESFFLYMEDTDLSLRARLAGYRCFYIPSSVVYHDYRLCFGPRKTYYQERNRYAMLLKTFHWLTLLLLAPALVLGELVAWGFVLLYEPQRLGNKARAYAWIFRRWRALMQDRQRTQQLRRARDRDLLRVCAYQLDYRQVDDGLRGWVAGLALNPIFYVLHRLVLGAVRW
jgi:GT2 family glycosyltransferase